MLSPAAGERIVPAAVLLEDSCNNRRLCKQQVGIVTVVEIATVADDTLVADTAFEAGSRSPVHTRCNGTCFDAS